jgi:hypothetical protein
LINFDCFQNPRAWRSGSHVIFFGPFSAQPTCHFYSVGKLAPPFEFAAGFRPSARRFLQCPVIPCASRGDDNKPSRVLRIKAGCASRIEVEKTFRRSRAW